MNFINMDLNLLRLFDAVFKTHSVTLAAMSLDLSQPAASKQLTRLRDLLRDPLFVRTNDGMAPTPRATALAKPIRQALSTMRDALERQDEFDPRTSSRTFRVFITDVGQMVLIDRLLELIAAEAPRVGLETLQTPLPRDRAAALEAGEVEIALGHFHSFDATVHCEVLFEDYYVAMVRAAHPSIRGHLSLEQLQSAPQLVYQASGDSPGIEQALLDASVQRQVAVRLAHVVGMSSTIAKTDLLMIVPYRLALACAQLVAVTILELPIAVPRYHIAQYWHHRYNSDSGNRWLRTVLHRLFAQAPSLPSFSPEVGTT
jgi:DNA-binding transcriptional LysR family regulator